MTLLSSLFLFLLFLNPTVEMIGWVVGVMTPIVSAIVGLSTLLLRMFISTQMASLKETILTTVKDTHPSREEIELTAVKLQNQIDDQGRELARHEVRLAKLEGRTGH